MDVVPVSMGPNATARLIERIRDDQHPWTLRASADAQHPSTTIESDPVKTMEVPGRRSRIVMERADRIDLDTARRDAAAMISMLLDVSIRPVHDGIPARMFLATVCAMLDRMERRVDVHARGPWLPIRICVKDDGPPPFGPATLAAWNAICAPGLQVTHDLPRRRCVVGSPQTVHASPKTRHTTPIVDLMRTIPILEDLIVD